MLATVPEELWTNADELDMAGDPAHARGRKNADRKGRSRVFTVTVVLASLLVALVAAAAVAHSLHHPTTPPAAPPARSTPAVPSTGTSRLQTATDATDSATTAARVALTSLSDFPTPTNVATIINPYISSLQLYGTFLSGAHCAGAGTGSCRPGRDAGAPGPEVPRHHRRPPTGSAGFVPGAIRHRLDSAADNPQRTRTGSAFPFVLTSTVLGRPRTSSPTAPPRILGHRNR